MYMNQKLTCQRTFPTPLPPMQDSFIQTLQYRFFAIHLNVPSRKEKVIPIGKTNKSYNRGPKADLCHNLSNM